MSPLQHIMFSTLLYELRMNRKEKDLFSHLLGPQLQIIQEAHGPNWSQEYINPSQYIIMNLYIIPLYIEYIIVLR